jgi:4-alpha-glucanotransferase
VWASREALLATLSALGAPARDGGDLSDAIRERRRWYWERPLEPVVVAWDGRLSDVPLRVPAGLDGDRVECGLGLDGTDEVIARRVRVRHAGTAEVDANRFVDLRFGLKERLPFGYHTLRVRFGRVEAEATVISAPPRGTRPGRAKAWGAFLPLYALRTERNLGVGDLTDLAELAGWIAGLGGGVLATLPLLAAFDGRLFEASPYSPASRLFWNELYVDVTRVPELEHCGEARDLLGSNETLLEARRLRSARLVDFHGAMALKRSILEALARSFFESPTSPSRRRAHHEFLSVNPAVEDYAAFRAVCDRRGQPWQRWPEPARSGILRPNGADESTRRYHRYAQWLAWEQMDGAAAAARAKGTSLYLDLPLGVNPAGYDVWRERGLFALDAGAGAPPDRFYAKGQDWGFPPLHPDAVREQRYRYPIACLRTVSRHADLLRIDHVMGLHRLYWIPQGFTSTDGVYVRGHPEEWYAIVTLESARSGTLVIGEDLGTLPRSLRPAMARHGVQRSWVLPFELTGDRARPLEPPTGRSVVSLNTHDLHPFAGFWRCLDIDIAHERGWISPVEARRERATRERKERALIAFLRRTGWLSTPSGGRAPESDVLDALLRYLASSEARLVMVNLEDLFGETKPQNVPGTTTEYPNWRRAARYSFERFRRLPRVAGTLRDVDRLRSTGTR